MQFAAVHPTILNILFNFGIKIVTHPIIRYNKIEIIISSFFVIFTLTFLTFSSLKSILLKVSVLTAS